MIAFMAIFVWILLFIIALLVIIISEYKSERIYFNLRINSLKRMNEELVKENHELWNEIYKRRN